MPTCPYSQIERLVNLGALPPTGFTVSCFPLKIVGASGAPARVVAHVPGDQPPAVRSSANSASPHRSRHSWSGRSSPGAARGGG